jgi:hypothetical protein
MSRLWYLVALVPIAIGVIVVVKNVRGLFDDIEHMQRVVVPGERTLKLDAGDYVIYGETKSRVDGVSYINESFNVRCALSAADGTAIKLESKTGSSQYTLAGYEGHSMFDVSIPKAGDYHFACEGDSKAAVLAFGHGIGMTLVVTILAGVFGLLLSGGVFLLVFLKRRKK